MVKVDVKRVVTEGGGPRPDQFFSRGRHRGGGGCLGAIAKWFASAGIIMLMAHYMSAITIDGGFGRALVVALVIGFLNVFVRPLLVLLTLPITILTLGLFVLVINAVLLLLTSWLLEGFHIDGFGWALLAALILAVGNVLIDRVLGRK